MMTLEPFSEDTLRRFNRFEARTPEADVAATVAPVPGNNLYNTVAADGAISASLTPAHLIGLADQYDPRDEGGSVRLAGRRRMPTTIDSVQKAQDLSPRSSSTGGAVEPRPGRAPGSSSAASASTTRSALAARVSGFVRSPLTAN